MTYRWMLLCNTALGALGIGLAQLQRGRSRFYYWAMIGSGMLLLLPIFQYFFGRLALLSSNYNVYHDYQAVTLLATMYLIAWGRWLAYALLFLGVLDLKNDRSEASLAGATLPAHPTVASDADAEPDESGKPEA